MIYHTRKHVSAPRKAKAKPPVIEIEKWYGMAKPEGEARAGIESLSLWIFWHLKG